MGDYVQVSYRDVRGLQDFLTMVQGAPLTSKIKLGIFRDPKKTTLTVAK